MTEVSTSHNMRMVEDVVVPRTPKLFRTEINVKSDRTGMSHAEKIELHISSQNIVNQQESSETVDGTSRSSSGLDITATNNNDDDWDTDLELNSKRGSADYTGKRVYLDACEELGVVPVSYFMRHIQCEEVGLKHHGLGPMGAKAIAIPLVTNTNILKLDLEGNWLEAEGAAYIAEMLKENYYISDLNLSNNRIGSKGLYAICDMLKTNGYIKHLDLSGNELKDGDADPLAEALLDNNKLNELNLSHNDFSKLAGEILGHAIGENEILEHLDLSWNHLRRGGAAAICEGIKVNARLKTFNMSWNGLADDGAAAMADALKNNNMLRELDISNNRITSEGIKHIGKALDVNEMLEVLKIGKNPFREEGALILLNFVNNERSVLKVLDLTDVFVTKEFEELKKEMQQSRDITIIYEGVLGNWVLTGKYAKNENSCGCGMDIDSMSSNDLEDCLQNNPIAVLKAWIDKRNLRLLDVFNQFDKDKNMQLTHEEFKHGVKQAGINLNERQLDILVDSLDSGPTRDGFVDYKLFQEFGIV